VPSRAVPGWMALDWELVALLMRIVWVRASFTGAREGIAGGARVGGDFRWTGAGVRGKRLGVLLGGQGLWEAWLNC